ncbi:MAG: transketolase [Lachnospiraceae bacterium]|nr:transketolase [Lachnospiraceae bacterium]
MNRDLEQTALAARQNLFYSLGKLGSGHYGACLSEIELLTYLYCEELRVDPANPEKPDRDRFVLSKGHGGFGLYCVMAECGFLPRKRIAAFENGVMLPKHADKHRIPGVDVSTGSLGQGLSVAVGMALYAKREQKTIRVYAVLGDGECNEGQIWEAAMSASKYRLDNLIAAVDYNGLQFDGDVNEVMPLEPFADKWEAYGWHAIEVKDGHDFDQIRAAYQAAKEIRDKPVVIIARTVKGKGISFMENETTWHGGSCTKEQLQQGYRDLGMEEGWSA